MKTDSLPAILLAEDNESFGLMLKKYLELNSLKVVWAKNGREAKEIMQESDFDLYIFDIMMPVMDGFTLAEQTHKLRLKKPMIFLTAKSLKEDQVQGYKLGAVDYLIKPFDPDILLLKVNALLEQTREEESGPTHIAIGSFTYKVQERLLEMGSFKKRLSPKEGELLLLLNQNRDTLLKREETLLKIWKDDGYFTTQSMNVFITRLRGYFHHDAEYNIDIENIRGSGYIFRVADKK